MPSESHVASEGHPTPELRRLPPPGAALSGGSDAYSFPGLFQVSGMKLFLASHLSGKTGRRMPFGNSLQELDGLSTTKSNETGREGYSPLRKLQFTSYIQTGAGLVYPISPVSGRTDAICLPVFVSYQ